MPGLSIFELCVPREDVLHGRLRDEEFAADLAQVINETAPREYGDAGVFFRHTFPTRGLRELLDTACRRLSGVGGELNSVIRLDTQFGGGKTHSLIALVHAVREGRSVPEIKEFVDPAVLPGGRVRIAALDGENADPTNGLQLAPGIKAYSLWGEMAFRLGGEQGFRRVEESDRRHIAPGTPTIVELFGGEPTLILIDEVAVYLRKVARAFPDATNQFTAFVQALFKAVSATPNACLVSTLAVRADTGAAQDAYKAEQQIAMNAFQEAESVIARKATQLNPTEESETVDVVRRRLFERIDDARAESVIADYFGVWDRNKDTLPSEPFHPDTRDLFRHGYPFHPETLGVLTEKTSSLSLFQRTRGMLRLLARTVHALWQADPRPLDASAIHPHHIDPGVESIRGEITTKLGQGEYASALKADVAAVPGTSPAIAQKIDQEQFPGQPPVTSYAARTIFLHTLAYGDAAKGVQADWLRYSVCSPLVEPTFVDSARKKFIAESLYLDDRPGSPLRFMTEPNLNQLVRKAESDVDPEELRAVLNERVRSVFDDKGKPFDLVVFPAGPYEVPDEIGDGCPFLAVLGYDAFSVSDEPQSLPAEIVRMATRKGANEELRTYRNNVVFLVADSRLIPEMKQSVRHRLGLQQLKRPERLRELADHQQRQVSEEFEKSAFRIAEATMQCYRHLFYPSHIPLGGSEVMMRHSAIELTNASESPGNGQLQVVRTLRDQQKLLMSDDSPPAPGFTRDQTPLKTKGEISTFELRSEFRKAPKLAILLDDNPLIRCIRQGIDSEVFLYQKGDLLCGKGDPPAEIEISENAFVHTIANATAKGLWPRQKPKTTATGVGTEGATGGTTRGTGGTGSGAGGNGGGEGGTGRGGSGDGGPGGGTATKPPPDLQQDGPLSQALTQIFERAQALKIARFGELRIKMFNDFKSVSGLHQAVATFKGAEVSCEFKLNGLEAEGIEEFKLVFCGRLDKANAIKSFIESQMRAANATDFDAQYTLRFAAGLDTGPASADSFKKSMTKYGGGEAYVEATAFPGKEA